MSKHRRAFSLIELLISLGLFSLMTGLLWTTMQSTAQIWRRSSSRDNAQREILRARAHLTRDLANASRKLNQFATTQTGPSLGAGRDGDALTFLTCENGTTPWNITATGSSVMTAEITYALFVPVNVNTLYGHTFAGVADANGYEQGCPFKWLVRRQDPAPAALPPADPQIPATWTTTLLQRPATTVPAANQQVVATQLLGFRVLGSGGMWQIELKAVAIEDASRHIGIGPSALGNTTYTIVQMFTVPAHN